MTDGNAQPGADDRPRAAVRLEPDLLEEAAGSRVQHLLESAINEEQTQDPWCDTGTPPWKKSKPKHI